MIRRYDVSLHGPIENDAGAWVRYDDHAAEVERLSTEGLHHVALTLAARNALPDLLAELHTLRARVAELEDENERLRAKLEDTDRIGRDALRKGGHPAPDDWNAAYAIGWLEARNDREFRVTQAQREAVIYGAAWAENARFYNAKIIDPVECAAAASEAAEKAVEIWRAAQKGGSDV